MERIIATYEKKYKLKLTQPVQVEVYPNHEDFAVRTLGMPGLGALGVTFGYTIAMDSPSGRPPGDFHWASTLWHEMSHVFTLTHDQFARAALVHRGHRGARGDRGLAGVGRPADPEVHRWPSRTRNCCPSPSWTAASSTPQTPAQVVVSYFQAGRICDYITDKCGWDTILAMLRDFAADDDTPTVIRKELKMEPAEFDKQFLAFVEADTKKTVDNFDEWKKRLKQVDEMSKAKDYDGVIKQGTAIRDLFPDYVEAGSVYEFLASAYLAKNDKPAAIGRAGALYHASAGAIPRP